jgi:hypothetical protein
MKAENLSIRIEEYVLQVSSVKYENKNICIDVWIKRRDNRIICATAVYSKNEEIIFSTGFPFWEKMFGEKQTTEIIRTCENKIIEWEQKQRWESLTSGRKLLFID